MAGSRQPQIRGQTLAPNPPPSRKRKAKQRRRPLRRPRRKPRPSPSRRPRPREGQCRKAPGAQCHREEGDEDRCDEDHPGQGEGQEGAKGYGEESRQGERRHGDEGGEKCVGGLPSIRRQVSRRLCGFICSSAHRRRAYVNLAVVLITEGIAVSRVALALCGKRAALHEHSPSRRCIAQ